MKESFVAAAALTLAMAGAATVVQAGDAPPPWAYGFTRPVLPGIPPAEPNPKQVLDNITLSLEPANPSASYLIGIP